MTHSADQHSALTEAAEEIARINIEIAELTEYKNELLSVFKNPNTNLPPRTQPYEFGKVDVKVSASGRIDDGLAKRLLPEAIYSLVSKQTIDTAKARKALSEEEIASITKQYDNKIEIKLR